jgi:hypothetical protein
MPGVLSSQEEVVMSFDLEKVAEVVVALMISSSVLLVAAAIAWRLAVKPSLRELFEHRTARTGGDPLLSRRVVELEEEVRALKDRMAALTEGNPTRPLGADVPWRGTKEKV